MEKQMLALNSRSIQTTFCQRNLGQLLRGDVEERLGIQDARRCGASLPTLHISTLISFSRTFRGLINAFTRRKSVHLQESNQDAVFELSTQSMESSVTKMRRRKLSLCWSAIAYTRHKFFRFCIR